MPVHRDLIGPGGRLPGPAAHPGRARRRRRRARRLSNAVRRSSSDGGAATTPSTAGPGSQALDGGDDDDTLLEHWRVTAFVGGNGFDTVDLSARATAIRVGVSSATDSVATAERVLGGSADDVFRLSTAAERIEGGGGTDRSRTTTAGRPCRSPPTRTASPTTARPGRATTSISIENILGGAGNDVLGGTPASRTCSTAAPASTRRPTRGRVQPIVANLDDARQ